MVVSLFTSFSDWDVRLIKDIFRGGRGGGSDDDCGVFVLMIFSGVAADCGKDDLIVGREDGGGGLFVLKMLLGDVFFPLF